MILEQEDLEKRSTIQVSEELRNALKGLGRKGESYEDILWRLIQFWDSSHEINVAGPSYKKNDF